MLNLNKIHNDNISNMHSHSLTYWTVSDGFFIASLSVLSSLRYISTSQVQISVSCILSYCALVKKRLKLMSINLGRKALEFASEIQLQRVHVL